MYLRWRRNENVRNIGFHFSPWITIYIMVNTHTLTHSHTRARARTHTIPIYTNLCVRACVFLNEEAHNSIFNRQKAVTNAFFLPFSFSRNRRGIFCFLSSSSSYFSYFSLNDLSSLYKVTLIMYLKVYFSLFPLSFSHSRFGWLVGWLTGWLTPLCPLIFTLAQWTHR